MENINKPKKIAHEKKVSYQNCSFSYKTAFFKKKNPFCPEKSQQKV